MLLGVGAVGINMVRTMETIQLARDAGHMYARGVDFSQPGNVTVLLQVGSSLGLTSSSTTSKAVVILSALTYVDVAACTSLGYVSGGVPTSACTNYQRWVFTQRVTIGRPSLRASNFGSPLTSGTGSVTVNSTTGKISASDYITKTGARATFSGVNPYAVVSGNVQGLPSGEVLYIAEAAGTGFSMRPFINNAATYSYGLF